MRFSIQGLIATQNSPFSSSAMAEKLSVLVCTYPRKDGQVELIMVVCYVLSVDITNKLSILYSQLRWRSGKASDLRSIGRGFDFYQGKVA